MTNVEASFTTICDSDKISFFRVKTENMKDKPKDAKTALKLVSLVQDWSKSINEIDTGAAAQNKKVKVTALLFAR